jgi:hypothetical protein
MEHISNSELRAFIERRLLPDQLLMVDDHLAVCSDCRAVMEREIRVGRTVSGLQTSFAVSEPHLDYEQILSLALGRKIPPPFEQHAANCASCAFEAEDLRNFVAETGALSRPFREVQPIAPKPRILSWRPRLVWSAVAAAVILGAGFYWQISHHTSRSGAELASLRDGGTQLSLDKNGKLHGAEALQSDQREALQASLTSGRLPVNIPSNLTPNQQETLLGAPTATRPFKVIAPVSQVVIDNQPTFTWERMPAATGYRIRVYAAGYEKIAESPVLQGDSWQANRPLARGQTYTWTVTAESPKGEVRAPAPPQPEAAFEVADTGTAARLEQASASHGTDHLLLAILYARDGAIDEARAQLDLLALQNPGSKLVDQLRASLNQSAPSPISTNPAQ